MFTTLVIPHKFFAWFSLIQYVMHGARAKLKKKCFQYFQKYTISIYVCVFNARNVNDDCKIATFSHITFRFLLHHKIPT